MARTSSPPDRVARRAGEKAVEVLCGEIPAAVGVMTCKFGVNADLQAVLACTTHSTPSQS